MQTEALSPDGQFAFRYTTGSDGESKTYDLIERKTGKLLAQVAESDPDMGPSARFSMKVLWRPDSRAFALTATLWKRGSYIAVYRRDGAVFHEIKIPELEAEIPEKLKEGKDFPHVVELNSQSARRWQKDGSLVSEIETIQDGDGATARATRTVILGFDRSNQAKVLRSTVKFTTNPS
jgi:hypothetical protein